MTIGEAFEVRTAALVADGRSSKTLKNYHCAKVSLLKAIGDIPIALLGKKQIALWRLYMQQEGATDTYIRTQYSKLKSVLGYLLDNGVKVMEPRTIKSPKRDTAPRIVLTTQEVKNLVDAGRNVRDRAIMALTFLTGARISEVLSLEKDQFLEVEPDERGWQEIIVRGKGGKYRPLFINAQARQYVQTYLDTRRHPKTGKFDYYKPLFMSGQHRQITVSRVEQIIHQAAAYAGLDKRVTPHILRHSKATELLEKEAPIELVSKMLGHSNVAITSKIYSHVRTKAQKDMLDKYSIPI